VFKVNVYKFPVYSGLKQGESSSPIRISFA